MAKKKTDEAEQIESAVAGAASEVKEKVEKVAEEVEADVKEAADETTLDKKSKKKVLIKLKRNLAKQTAKKLN